MADKYALYAVARGFDKQNQTYVTNILFKSWNEAKPYVVGIENARYKGFKTEEEANIWLSKVSAEEVAPSEAKAKLPKTEIEAICKELGMSKSELDVMLEKRFIEDYKLFKKGGR